MSDRPGMPAPSAQPPSSVYRYDAGPILDLVRTPLSGDRYLHWLSVQDGRAGVAVIATDGESVLLQRQWRPAVDAFVWQFPRGFGEPIPAGEQPDPRQDAARELREETGISSAELTVIGRILPDPGILSGEIIVVEAQTSLRNEGEFENNDLTETIDDFAIVELSLLDSWITGGQLVDGITLAALQLWRVASAPAN